MKKSVVSGVIRPVLKVVHKFAPGIVGRTSVVNFYRFPNNRPCILLVDDVTQEPNAKANVNLINIQPGHREMFVKNEDEGLIHDLMLAKIFDNWVSDPFWVNMGTYHRVRLMVSPETHTRWEEVAYLMESDEVLCRTCHDRVKASTYLGPEAWLHKATVWVYGEHTCSHCQFPGFKP